MTQEKKNPQTPLKEEESAIELITSFGFILKRALFMSLLTTPVATAVIKYAYDMQWSEMWLSALGIFVSLILFNLVLILGPTMCWDYP